MPRALSLRALSLFALTVVAACHGIGEDRRDAAPDGGDDALRPCTRERLEPDWERATLEGFGLQYTGLTSEEAPYDALRLQLYDGAGGPSAPGRYSLEGTNYSDCGLCLLAFSGCDQRSCEKTFYAAHGEVELITLGGLGDQLAASFHDVLFDEVTVDQQTYLSTPVPGGERWCLDSFAFDQPIVDPVVATCAEEDITCVGEEVEDFRLQNCLTGQMVSLRVLSEGWQALWLVLTAGWCSACHEYMPRALSQGDELAERGLATIVVVGEDDRRGQPSLAYCLSYAERYNVNPARFFIDHDGQSAFATTFAHIFPYLHSSSTVELPWNGVLDAETFEYVHGDGDGSDLDTALLSLIDEP